MQQPRRHQLPDHIAQASGGVEMVHIRKAIGIDLGHQRHDIGNLGKVLQVQQDARRPRHGGQVQHQVGGPARGHQADDAVDKGAFIQNFAHRAEIIAQCGDRGRLFDGGIGQRLPQRGAGVDETGTRQVQAHEFHQHLVGIGGAVEGTGAGAVIAGHLGRHQRVAPDLAGGELVADPGLFVIRQAAGHRACGDENRRHMAEGGRSDDQARHDLVADAQVESGVKAIVAERHAGGQRDDIAREQRQFHPRLALGDTVTHGRDAACHLGGGPGTAGGGPDLAGIAFKRLMRRQHVVIGGDDAQVGRLSPGQFVLVLARGGIGMGLIAAGQMRPGRAIGHGLCHAVQIGAACGGRSFADAAGHGGNGAVQGHGRFLRVGGDLSEGVLAGIVSANNGNPRGPAAEKTACSGLVACWVFEAPRGPENEGPTDLCRVRLPKGESPLARGQPRARRPLSGRAWQGAAGADGFGAGQIRQRRDGAGLEHVWRPGRGGARLLLMRRLRAGAPEGAILCRPARSDQVNRI